MRDNTLFYGKDFHSYLNEITFGIKNNIDSIAEDLLLNSSTQDLANSITERNSISVPILDLENKVADKIEVDIERQAFGYSNKMIKVKGTRFIIEIPFAGDSQLFYYQPSSFPLNFPNGKVYDDRLVLSFEKTPSELENDGVKQLEKEIEDQIRLIQRFLSSIEEDSKGFNKSIYDFATRQIEGRKKKLLNDNDILKSLGFKLKENQNSSKTYAAPEVRRKISVTRELKANSPCLGISPEPILLPDDYENILEIIDNMSYVIERSPEAFAGMKEEHIRFHFLVQLNGHYEGQTTGETFNYNGKTDILIRSNDENIFIGECKFWKGEKKYLETIDQILSYTVWRVTKTAILVFNRNNEMSKVLNTIKGVTPKHKCFRRELTSKQETEFRYIFSHLNDKEKELALD